MTLGKYAHIALALCISVLLVTVTTVSVKAIYDNDRANVSHHILTRLQATTGIIHLWQQEYLMSVRSVAEDPGLADLVDKLIRQKISTEEASAKMDQWLRPIYLGRGYEGHSIITPDHTIILASSPAFVGKQVSSPSSREGIDQAFRDGVALARPSEATYQVRMLDRIAGPGTLFQIGCAQIRKNRQVLAVLCLRQDPYRNFFPLLSTGFSGESGEAYAVDRNGNIVSPTRFGHTIINQKSRTGQSSSIKSSYIKGLQARVPTKSKNGVYKIDAKSPLTKGMAAALRHGESGFINSYQDYRNVEVVGAVKWIPDMEMGIVIEQDVREVYGPFNLSSKAIIGLGVLATILINALILAQAASRRSLAEREQLMRAFLDNFPGLAHMRDTAGRFLIANKHMEAFLNTSRAELIGQTHESVSVPQKYVNELVNDHTEVLRTGQVVERVKEAKDLRYNNAEWLKTIRFPVFDRDTKEIFAVGNILLDITEQVRNARELEAIRVTLEHRVEERTAQFEAAKHEAEQAARVKADFLANMSHEIRTPMNAIIGLSHLATMISDDPKLRNYLQRIHQSSSHLLSIINDILDFSKIEAGKMTIERTDFSLEDMLDKVIGLLWEKADDKGLELLLQIDSDVPDNLNGDALRIGQVLINFVSNAVKFTEAGDVILRVRKIVDQDTSIRVRFEVQDSGIGIAPDRFNQLFKPFHQLDTSSTRRFEGTGLGLTISKNLVEIMNGELDIQSTPGVGSTFSIELNLNKGSQQEPLATRQHTQERRVLVVDDNQHAREILAHMLDDLLLDVSQADSGLAALDLILAQEQHELPFDIIFLDWKMPGISGIETAERISQLALSKQPKLVLVSAHNKQDLDSSLENVVDTVITKPVTPSVLYDTVSSMLKNIRIKSQAVSPLDINPYHMLAEAKVLLVDDNDINQDVVRELLKLVNAKVSVASNGQEALSRVSESTFDVILMDVQMPVMDGIEATRRIRSLAGCEHLPIIAMTANALAEDRELCLKVGMSDYISKPIDPDILFRTMLRWFTAKTISGGGLLQNSNSISDEDTRIAKLNTIPGMDVEPALERLLNNNDFYLKLIQRFINERSDIVEVIKIALAESNVEEATRQAHTFKSLAGTIGAVELQDIALQIEMKLREGDACDQLLTDLQTALSNLILSLKENL